MINNRRRNFRQRGQKNNFRRRNGSSNPNNGSNFSNGNLNFSRNGSTSNPHTIEKNIQKFQQLAKDAQSSGDPVMVENYLQHADHYSRRLAEINHKNKSGINNESVQDTSSVNEKKLDTKSEDTTQKTN